MRFLVFNIVVAGAVFYLLSGNQLPGFLETAKAPVEQPSKVDTVLASKLDALAKQVEIQGAALKQELTSRMAEKKKATPKAAPKVEPKPAPKQVSLAKAEPKAPPMPAPKEVKKLIPQKAPLGESKGTVETATAAAPTLAEETHETITPSPKRRKALRQLVADMEQMFVEKMVR